MYQTIRITSHFKTFQCSLCGECCRGGWRIPVNDSKADNYLKNSPGEMPAVIKDSRGWKVNLLPDQRCPLLETDQSCRLHRKEGLSALGDTCRAYPRVFIRTQKGVEAGLSYSCPASLKLLKEMDFYIETLPATEYRDYFPESIPEIELPGWHEALEEKILDTQSAEKMEDLLNMRTFVSGRSYDSIDFLLSEEPSQRFKPLAGVLELLIEAFLRQPMKDCPDLSESLKRAPHITFPDQVSQIFRKYLQNQVFVKTILPDEINDLAGMILLLNGLLVNLYEMFLEKNTHSPAETAVRVIEKYIMHSDWFRRKIIAHLRDWYP